MDRPTDFMALLFVIGCGVWQNHYEQISEIIRFILTHLHLTSSSSISSKLTWVWQMLQALINPAIMLTTSRNRTEWNLNGNIKTWTNN